MRKKEYRAPVLIEYFDLRDVTMGNSPGAKESGDGGPYKVTGFDPPPPPPPGANEGGSTNGIFD